MKTVLIPLLIAFIFCQLVDASESLNQDKPGANFSTLYLGDLVKGFSGGTRTGSCYLGLIDIAAEINTQGLGLWKGGSFMINIQNTHYGTPSADFVGDLQVFSNIENGDYTYLYQLWYRQQLGRFWILGGLHDLNSEFFTSDYAGEYINSSFGIMPITTLNTPVSIFPKTALALIGGFNSDAWSVKAGVYDGNPGSLEEDKYNLNFDVRASDGYYSILEISLNKSLLNERTGTFKFGAFYHSGSFESFSDSTLTIKGNYGYYFIADQKLYSENLSGDEGLGVLFQIGFAPDDRNLNDFYCALGLNYTGLLPKRSEDVLGLATAHASLGEHYMQSEKICLLSAETVFELSYKAMLGNHLMLQPNLQYVVNPGACPGVNNALVGILRICITY